MRLFLKVIVKPTKLLMELIVKRWGASYPRRPNEDEINTILERSKERGMHDCMRSLYSCHWEWHQCPTGTAETYQARLHFQPRLVHQLL